MADESPPTAGKRFSEDLRQIREERGISIEEIQEETQIAETLITSFEEGRLYDHPTYNRVYLRSFIRAYADALNISRSDALEGLDAALEGTYDDALASTYLNPRSAPDRTAEPESGPEDGPEGAGEAGAESTIEVTDAPTAGGPEGRGGIVGPPRAVGESPPDDSLRGEQGRADDAGDDVAPDEDGSGPRSSEESEPEPPESDVREQDASEPEAPASTDERSDSPDEPASVPDAEPAPSEAEESEAEEAPSAEAEEAEPDETADEGSAPDDTPDWMAAPDDADSEESSPAEPSPPTAAPEEPDDVPVGGDDLGVVGEPTELGSTAAGEAEAGRTQASSAPGRSHSTSSSWIDGLLGERQGLYVTGIGIAVVLLVLVGLGVAYFSTGGEQPAASAAPGADTTMASAPTDTASGTSRPPVANVSIGSAIDLMLLANTNVGGIRLQRDDDLRRPYWIEEGEADVFPFQETVTIENGLSDVQLFIEGYPYPVPSSDTTDALQITRAQVQAFVDTLRGAPPSLSVSPDTIPVGTPDQ